MKKTTVKAVIIGALAVSGSSVASENPFSAKVLSSGYMVAEAGANSDNATKDTSSSATETTEKHPEGKCAANGKCGASMKKKKSKKDNSTKTSDQTVNTENVSEIGAVKKDEAGKNETK